MFCKNCGSQMTDSAPFCPQCGTPTGVNPTANQPVNNNPSFNPVSSPAYSDPFAANPGNYSMKWYNFIVKIGLFLSALLNLINAISFFSGSAYGDEKELVYAFFGSLKTLDILMGIVFLALAAFCIYVRMQLAGFKANSLKLILILYVSAIVVDIIYLIAVLSILSDAGISLGDILNASNIASFLTSIVMAGANYVYFKKRSSLFVN